MTPRTHPVASAVAALLPLVRAEATAEAPAAGMEAADLEQTVWLRLFETWGRGGPPAEPARWVRSVVRAQARRSRRTARRERPIGGRVPEPEDDVGHGPEGALLMAERRRAVWAALERTPGDCPRLLAAMLSPNDLTYREIAGELGISQGSLGPMRSRCLGCLRRMLAVEVGAPARGGKER